LHKSKSQIIINPNKIVKLEGKSRQELNGYKTDTEEFRNLEDLMSHHNETSK